MSTQTTVAPATSTNGTAAGVTAQDDVAAMPYCAACGHWVGMFASQDGWQHFRGGPGPGRGRSPYDAGHDVVEAWCSPPAGSVSPAQHEQLLAALDDAIAYREHAAASGYATAYRVLRRQLASKGQGSVLAARSDLDFDALAVTDARQGLRELAESERLAQQRAGADGACRHQVGCRAEAVEHRH